MTTTMAAASRMTTRDDTIFLRFIAIVLVLNSHLDLYYPIPFIGTGGAIGNTLFFMLSSFGLLLSEQKHPRGFLQYTYKRFSRIYPAVWIVLILISLPIQFLPHLTNPKIVTQFLSRFLIPPFWFLKGLLLYYLLGYFLIKRYSQRRLFIFVAVAFMAYVYWYTNYLDLSDFAVEDMPFKLSFYVMVFMFGIYLADINHKIRYSGIGDVVIFLGTLFCIYGHKLLMTMNKFGSLQILQQLLLFVVAYYAFKISRSPFVLDKIMKTPVVSRVIRFISSITLEIFIVHATISPFIVRQKFSFPFNVIVFLGATLVVSVVIHQLSSRAIRSISFASSKSA